jgi:hypothetical protein
MTQWILEHGEWNGILRITKNRYKKLDYFYITSLNGLGKKNDDETQISV